MYNTDSNNYAVSTTANGEYFADFLYKAFGPYNPANDVPRPFDYADQHVAVDGFDFDLEHKLGRINPDSHLLVVDMSLTVAARRQQALHRHG